MSPRPLATAAILSLFATAALAGVERRIERALDWPRADLAGYDAVFVEDCRVTDPQAAERKAQGLVEEAPKRMADYIAASIDDELFPRVERRPPGPGEAGIVVRVELTQYKPGSEAARALLAGAGAARLDLAVRILDAESGAELASFAEERNFSGGGMYGASRGITLLEEKAAVEIGAYLSLSKGLDEDEVAARMRDLEPAGPPEAPHATIYLMRPQGFVGGAGRFRVGLDDAEAGSSKRNTYFLVYASPGAHRVWRGSDKRKKYKPLEVEAGQSYYWDVMNMKPIPPAKGPNKLDECKLVRTLDLTRGDEGAAAAD